MAVTTEIPWGDGSGDKIYLTRNASEGDQNVQVSSDANTGNARSKVVTFTSGVGNIQRQLTINQAAGREPLPAEDGRIWAYYDVNTTTSNTQILYSGAVSNLAGTMLVDGVSKSRATAYTFPTTGMHLVQFNLVSSNTTLLPSQFRNLARARRIFVPSKITSFGNYCFYQSSSIEYIVFRSLTPPTRGNNPFSGSYNIYVPYSADHSVLNAYKTAWSNYSSRIKELNEDGSVPG